MYTKAKELSNEYNVKFLLEESPFETGTLRLAKSDLKRFPDIANKYVQGDIKTDSVYYTNSIHYRYSSDINFIKRIIDQGKFSKLIEAGSITHVFLGEHLPPAKALMKVVINTYNNTSCEQLAFSPEFTLCNNCNKTSRGLLDKCPDCGSENIDGLTRITGYFSKTSSWNKGKLAELKDRRHESI
jgi:ribonucleoside-triphosphate reductase